MKKPLKSLAKNKKSHGQSQKYIFQKQIMIYILDQLQKTIRINKTINVPIKKYVNNLKIV